VPEIKPSTASLTGSGCASQLAIPNQQMEERSPAQIA